LAGPTPHADHFHSSRPWIGTDGPSSRRATTLTFVLQKAGLVVFTVNELAPACLGIGRFTRTGHVGLNRVRFAGVVHGRQLQPGTYRIGIRTATRSLVRHVTLVVSESAPSQRELLVLRAANTCQGVHAVASTTAMTATRAERRAAGKSVQKLPAIPTGASAAGLAPQAPDLHSGVLGSAVEKTARAVEPLLVTLLGLSILLLGLASLPREAVPGSRAHDVLARHRIELAAFGAAALAAVALALLFT